MRLSKMTFLQRIARKMRFAFQARNRGWSDADTWSLHTAIAQFVCPRLKRFKELHEDHPPMLTEEEWNETIDKMIFAMESCTCPDFLWNEDTDRKIQEGLHLFAKYFCYLWW